MVCFVPDVDIIVVVVVVVVVICKLDWNESKRYICRRNNAEINNPMYIFFLD